MTHLKRTLANEEVVDRNWMLYSNSTNALFCFMCRLFGSSLDAFSSTGFKDFHNILRALKQHENSNTHIRNELTYKARKKESNAQTIDAQKIDIVVHKIPSE